MTLTPFAGASATGARPARPVPRLDLSAGALRLHVVGVGGPGMNAVATILAEMGHTVSGSDLHESPVLDRLRRVGVAVHVGHDPALVDGVDAVTWSTAIPPSNVELVAAREAGTVMMRRAGMLASICARARSVAVAGTHGKTTTTSLLTLILRAGGWNPSFVVGGDVAELGTGAHWTGAEWLVVEADESDLTHLELPLQATILTNVEADHLEHYGSFEHIVAGFRTYLAQIDGPKVLCADDPVCLELASELPGPATITYGTSEGADARAIEIGRSEGANDFTFTLHGERLGRVHLPLRGLHNVRNATAAIAMALALGVDFEAAAGAVADFAGVTRRFEVRAELGGIVLVDDYAHLPTEIAAVIDAARTSGDRWRRVVAVFQPNRFRRMAVLSPEYRDAFAAADVAVITDIYPSGDAPIEGVSGKLVVDAILDAHPDQRVVWLPQRAALIGFLAGELRDGDVCISMGCGDIATLPDEVAATLVAAGRGQR
jgi:UDP-N-acetylmuramate--alanine ligase